VTDSRASRANPALLLPGLAKEAAGSFRSPAASWMMPRSRTPIRLLSTTYCCVPTEMRLLGSFLLLSGAATAVRAQDSTPLLRARAFHCVFEKTWRGMVDASDQARAALPKDSIRELSFNEVDRAGGAARLTRDQRAHAVDVIQTPTTIVFVERDTPDLTFIFTAQDKAGRFSAVHSRRTTLANGTVNRISLSGACQAVP
jgi:hypothetical protein